MRPDDDQGESTEREEPRCEWQFFGALLERRAPADNENRRDDGWFSM